MEYLEELKKLNLPLDKYAVFGSGPLAIRGLRKNNDIDIIVSSGLWKKLKEKFKLSEKGQIEIKNIEIWNKWFDFNIDKLIKESEIIQGIPFVLLDYVLEWKESYIPFLGKRKKDYEDIKLIQKYLNQNKD